MLKFVLLLVCCTVLIDGFSDNYGKQPVRIKIISMGKAAVGKVCKFLR